MAVIYNTEPEFYRGVATGKTFIASTATAGIALIVPATTGNHPTLWNPAGSGVNLALIKMLAGIVSGTPALAEWRWAYTNPAGSAIGTAAPIVTFTHVDPQPALVGSSYKSVARWAPAVCTFAAIPTLLGATGVASVVIGTAASDAKVEKNETLYNGCIVIPPGCALSLCAQTSSGGLYNISLVYQEIPV